jgi:superfamily II DNA or RNA helicase
MSSGRADTDGIVLSDAERLQLQQLRLLAAAERRSERDRREVETDDRLIERDGLPTEWIFTRDIDLHGWQHAARSAWFDAGRSGTIKVVTGAGKTVVALAIAEQLHRDDPDLRVAIVVPTIVLMEQWYEELRAHSNLPDRVIGRLGGGHKDDLSGGRRVLVSVLASARKTLPTTVSRTGVGLHLLLVVDESHRAGAPEMSAVLSTERAYSLGLSATPEREEDDSGSDILSEELGEIVYEMSFADAVRDGVLPPFEIHHFGLPLAPGEAREYEALTRSVNDARRELRAVSSSARQAGAGDGLLAWARRVSVRRSDKIGALAARFVNDTTRRKQLLYRADARLDATLALVRRALAERDDARVILFHESIDEVVALFHQMTREAMPAVMEHSELPAELRESSLDLFRTGIAQVIVSARSLIEGFNVPEADLGVVVASSSSARQRIQSIGRVLRRYRDSAGEQKTSRVCVLYVRDSVDEAIYEKQDWDKLVGLDQNRYFIWDPPAEPLEQDAPPRAAIPTEAEVDVASLGIGALYPGRYDGAEYSTDALGNVLSPDGRIALNPQGLPERLAKLVERPGRFKVTPRKNAILVRRPADDEEWVTLFGGTLDEPFLFPSAETSRGEDIDTSRLKAGDQYDGPLEPATEYLFRQRGGGVVARRVPRGQEFAQGPLAKQLVEVLKGLSGGGRPITKFFVNEMGHAFWREEGAARFVAALDGELDFSGSAS